MELVLFTEAECLTAGELRHRIETYEQRIIGIRQQIGFLTDNLAEVNIQYLTCRDELQSRSD